MPAAHHETRGNHEDGKRGETMNSNWIYTGVFTILTLAGLAWGGATPKATSAQATNSGNAPVTLSAASPGSVGFDQSRLAQLNKAMHRMVDEGEVAGVMTMLARHGKIVNYDAYGKDNIAKGIPLRRDSIFRLFSQTKPITGVAMMILFEQGKWKLNDPISKHIPEFANLKVFAGLDKDGQLILEDPRQPPTMAMLMSHTAGFGYGLKQVNYVDYVNQQFQKLGVLSSGNSRELIQKIVGIPLLYQPGTRWQYSVGIDIQGYIVEKLSGQRLGDFLSQHVFAPLGMKDMGFYAAGEKAARLASVYKFDLEKKKLVELTPAQDQGIGDFTKQPSRDSGGGGDGGGWGGLVSTIDDFARFCQMILNGGTYNSVRILAPASVALMRADHMPATVIPEASGGFPAFGGQALGCGLDFGVIKDPAPLGMLVAPGSVFWGGGAGTWFWIDPKNDLFFLGMIQREGDDEAAVFSRLGISQTLVYPALTEPGK
jgi:CubicO group peptidase (beta-lactamase class C family)